MENRTIRIFLLGALGAVVALWIRGLVVDGFDAWMTVGAVLMTALIGVGILVTQRTGGRDRDGRDRGRSDRP